MKKLNYAIIGCGVFGCTHARALSTIKEANIVAVCDTYIEKCKALNEKFQLEASCYSNYMDMLEKEQIDIVVVATSDKEHKDASIAALKTNHHVMCEKPMSLFTEDCIEMIKAADEAHKLLMVGQVCRCTPAFIKAKELVDNGVIGELCFAESEYAHDYSRAFGTDNWRVDKDREPIIGGACHAIDLLRWIAGDPYETTAYSNHKMLTDWPVDDTTIAIMKFPNNVIGKVFTSIGCKRNYTMRTVLYGTKGTIIVNNSDSHFTLFLEKENENGGNLGDVSNKTVAHEIPVVVNNHNVPEEHKQLIDAVMKNKPLVTTGREGAKTVIACRAVVDSAKTGKSVKIDYGAVK